MKINLCYRDSTSETAQRLANDLASAIGCPIELTLKPKKKCFNIAWGFQGDARYSYLNNPKYVKANIDKLETNRKLEKAGCNIIKAYGRKEIVKAYQKGLVDTPIIARGRSTQNGNDMFICLCKKQLARAVKDKYEMFKPYIKPKQEFRVHIFKGKPILIIRKAYNNPYSIYRNDEDEVIMKRGYSKRLIRMCTKALEISGLDFGAVDVLEGEDNKLYILEINTAPALNKEMREPYIREIKNLLIQKKVIK